MRFDFRSIVSVTVIAACLSSLPPAQLFAQTDAAKTEAAKPPVQKGLATKAIEAAKGVAREASDILTRVPCLPAKGLTEVPGSLPRVARRIAAGDPVRIVAFGSSTTVGYGTSSPAYTYPNRLVEQLRRKFPTADITIINRGMGGQDAPEMMKRFDEAVLAENPDLVIWQLGTNTVVRGGAEDVAATAALVEDGHCAASGAGHRCGVDRSAVRACGDR